jgi:excinuclease ABC subunit B
VQRRYNEAHGITPTTVKKRITSLQDSIWESDYVTVAVKGEAGAPTAPAHELPKLIEALRAEMKKAAEELEFEQAADLRDRIRMLEEERLKLG